MKPRPFQVTLRNLIIAVFCLSASFVAFRAGTKQFAPLISLTVGYAGIYAAAIVILGNALSLDGRCGWHAYLGAMVAWQLIAFVMRSIYVYLVQLVFTPFNWSPSWFIDNPSYAFYVDAFVAYAAMTIPASAVGLWVFDRFSHEGWLRRETIISLVIWEVIVLSVLLIEQRAGLYYAINQADHNLFGFPDNIYSFRNIALPRILAWLLLTSPAAWIALRTHAALRQTHI